MVFDQATDELLDQIEVIIKLIRSKGVGIFFCTQLPTDIPDVVLSQLGLKIQHALRAFTAKDRKAIKKTAENYPITEYYDTAEIITQLGIGEALVTALNEDGIPTPLAATLMRGPATRMDVLSEAEIDQIVDYSTLTEKYNKDIDRESAYEILSDKIDRAAAEERQKEIEEAEQKEREVKQKQLRKKTTKRKTSTRRRTTNSRKTSPDIGETLIKELTRGLFGILGSKRR